METTVNVQSSTPRGEWINLQTDQGKIGVKVKDNPKLMEAINAAQTTPYPLYGTLVDKAGNKTFWDIKPKSDNTATFGKKEKYRSSDELIVAQVALKCSVEYNSTNEHDMTAVIEDATAMYKWLIQFKNGTPENL